MKMLLGGTWLEGPQLLGDDVRTNGTRCGLWEQDGDKGVLVFLVGVGALLHTGNFDVGGVTLMDR